MIDKKIGIIGCGNMGEALLSRLSKVMEKSVSIMVSETDTSRRDYIQTKYKMIVEIDNNIVVKYSDVIILAVKPKDFDQILKQEICCGISKDKLLVSIAAGVTLKYIENIVGKDIPVIRIMPNMAASIGEAISTISRGASAGNKDVEIVKEIFSAVGDVIEIDESLVDAVTAISGSGPAYFFCLMDAMMEIAWKLGLDKASARRLVLKTALGSVRLIQELQEEPASMIKKVASKGGTTEAAFKVFEKRCFKGIVHDAIKKAYKRAGELSKDRK